MSSALLAILHTGIFRLLAKTESSIRSPSTRLKVVMHERCVPLYMCASVYVYVHVRTYETIDLCTEGLHELVERSRVNDQPSWTMGTAIRTGEDFILGLPSLMVHFFTYVQAYTYTCTRECMRRPSYWRATWASRKKLSKRSTFMDDGYRDPYWGGFYPGASFSYGAFLYICASVYVYMHARMYETTSVLKSYMS